MAYTFIDHLHNYEIWTAARASQRGFTTTNNIRAAIEMTGLKDFSIKKRKVSSKDFDNFHRETARIIIDTLSRKGLKTSYGRAAKIIAIYLKTAVVIRVSGESDLAKMIHPPIDNILLTNLNRTNKELGLKGIKWTQLTENDYFNLIDKLRLLFPNNFWQLEQYWEPNQG